ncbi:MAG: ABC transporter permease subunit [Planctomycetota bacterium]|nr:ABC transporter permease subunit [Planctomycetota bacterium]MDA1090670.1 ABC transporter permease subunit [Pseudomonadota bacterium]
MSPARKWTLRLIGVGVFLLIWEGIGRLAGDALFAPLSSVIRAYPEMISEYNLFQELTGSLRQLVIGYLLGCVVGITVGAAMGRSRLVDGLLQPWVSMLFATSIAALVPLFILLFGFGLAFRVAIVFMSTVWYVLLNTYHGARGVDSNLLEAARAFDATPLQTLRMVLLPALYPYILAGMRNGLAHAIRAMVIVEMYIVVGFGGIVYNTGLEIGTAPLIGTLLTIMTVGVVLTEILKALGRLTAPWYERGQRA